MRLCGLPIKIGIPIKKNLHLIYLPYQWQIVLSTYSEKMVWVEKFS